MYSEKKERSFAVFCVVVSFALLYVLGCAAVTFMPFLRMLSVNKTACEVEPYIPERIRLPNNTYMDVFRAEGPQNKYVVVCPGGGYIGCSASTEGYSVAQEFCRMGYTAFVLTYRVGYKIKDFQAPLIDLAEAIKYIDINAEKYNVFREQYAICGLSAGGNLVGLFGTKKYGYEKFFLKKPEVIIMGYPWCNPTLEPAFRGNWAETAFQYIISVSAQNTFLGNNHPIDEMRVHLWVDEDYPRSYIMHGTADAVLPVKQHSDVLVETFKEKGIDYFYERPEGVNHACGAGRGTPAEGWIERAIVFWTGRTVELPAEQIEITDAEDNVEQNKE